MESTDSEGNRTARPRSSDLLYVSSAPDRDVVEHLSQRHRLAIARSVPAAESLEGRIACLLVDGDRLDGAADAVPDSVPVVVLADGDDPTLVRTVARRPGFDLVYRDGACEDPRGTELERLTERIDAARRHTPAALDEAVIETAGLLMSAAPDELDTRIEWGLRSVGEELGATRCVVYECDEGTLERTHEWSRTALAELDHGTVPAGSFPGFEDAIARFEPFVTAVEPGADADAGTPRSLGYGTGTFLAVPIVIDWNLGWVLVVGGVPPDAPGEPPLSRLETVGELIGHTLRRDRRHREIERQNERLERFASVISHDLQNPLSVISGYADLAKESGARADIERISEAASRMEAILDDLRTLARDAEDLGEREPIDVSTLVERSRTAVDLRSATVETEPVGVIEADPGRLRQAFENLFRNAIEHAGADVTIRVGPISGGFAVSDDGPGIPAGKREAVFEEGYTDDGGTGLGLSIVRTVIEAHGWSIEAAESDAGGARFEITGVEFADRRHGTTATA